MRNDLDFTEHSRLLGEGLFADSVILALSRYSKNRQLDDRDKKVLEKAQDFLNKVIEGGSFTSSVFHSARDYITAQAFTQAVNSVSIPISSKSDFLKYIEELQNIIDKILKGKKLNEERFNLVDSFFTRYSRIQFQRSRSMLEPA